MCDADETVTLYIIARSYMLVAIWLSVNLNRHNKQRHYESKN